MQDELKGKVAVIPGGTSGIGLAIAERYVQEGAVVAVCGRNAEKAKKAGEQLAAIGNKGYADVCDVTDENRVNEFFAEVNEKYGHIDIMLESAGVIPGKPFLKMTTDDWKYVQQINQDGPFYCTKAVAPYMVRQKFGRIIYITSAQGLRGIPLMAHYTACKGALIAMARCLASELGPYGITVNTIACGLTLTAPLTGGFTTNKELDTMESTGLHTSEELRILRDQQMPNKRLGEPTDFAGYAVCLASDGGAHITGTTLAIDGGMTSAQPVLGDLYQNL